MTTIHRTATTVYWTVESPIGELLLAGDGERLQRLHMQGGKRPGAVGADWERAREPFADLCEQLDQYFAGERREFDIPLDWRLTRGFTRDALQSVCDIPYGETAGYGEVAILAGSPRAARAVGTACATTPRGPPGTPRWSPRRRR